VPERWAVVIDNETGDAYDGEAANHDLQIQGIWDRIVPE
jgi:hypothetical protein